MLDLLQCLEGDCPFHCASNIDVTRALIIFAVVRYGPYAVAFLFGYILKCLDTPTEHLSGLENVSHGIFGSVVAKSFFT